MASGNGSVAIRNGQSAGSSRGRTTYQSTRASTTAAAPRVGHAHECSARKSVTSSWATWIQYSWGSLMSTQIDAAAPIHQASANRSGFHRDRTPS
jgi:hypothetical protein